MTVTALEKADYDVLNTVALKKMAAAPAIAEACGIDPGDAEAALGRLADRGLVAVAGGAALPTDDAEPALAEAAARFYAGVRDDAEVTRLADRFDTVNRNFLKTMSAWQVIDVGGRTIANTHADSAYDDKIIGRLARLVEQLTPLLDSLGGHDGRFALYRQRFEAAVAAVDQGRHDLVASPVADSVHTIWFEFHEDLLRTLGRARAE